MPEQTKANGRIEQAIRSLGSADVLLMDAQEAGSLGAREKLKLAARHIATAMRFTSMAEGILESEEEE